MVSLWYWHSPSTLDIGSYNATAYVVTIVPRLNETLVASDQSSNLLTQCSDTWTKNFTITTSNGTSVHWSLVANPQSSTDFVATLSFTGGFQTVVGFSSFTINVQNHSQIEPLSSPTKLNVIQSSETTFNFNEGAGFFEILTGTSVKFQEADDSSTSLDSKLELSQTNTSAGIAINLDFSTYPSVNNGQTKGPNVTLTFGLGLPPRGSHVVVIVSSILVAIGLLVGVGVFIIRRRNQQAASFERV